MLVRFSREILIKINKKLWMKNIKINLKILIISMESINKNK